MPQVIVTEGATEGLERCRQFLAGKAPEAARPSSNNSCCWKPPPTLAGRSPDVPELRELVIAFGDSGYVALYRHEATPINLSEKSRNHR